MANRRILGFDDDNHSPLFVDENGRVIGTAQKLINELAAPHTDTYEVRMFAIIDDWSEELSVLKQEMVDEMFDFLCGHGRRPDNGLTVEQTFDMFWDSANRNWW